LVQVNVETQEIDCPRTQEFGGRIVRESAKTLRVDFFCFPNQFIDKIADRPAAAPANNIRRDLVDDTEGEHGGVMPAVGDRLPDCLPGFLASKTRIQETKVLIPGYVDKHFQPILSGEIEKPPGGSMIHPDQVGVQLLDQDKIPGCLFSSGKSATRGIRGKGSVRNALDVKLFFTQPEEFTVHANARPKRSRSSHGF
jgi:hypothetical protein